MNIFLQQLQILADAKKEDLQNIYVQHGIVHMFQEQFTLGIALLQEALKEDGQGMAAMGSTKEIIMAAYEEYIFIEEDMWLHLMNDSSRMHEDIQLKPLVMRILMHYVPAWQQFVEHVQHR